MVPVPGSEPTDLYTRLDGDTSFSPSAVPPNDTMDGAAEDADGNIWDPTASTAVDYEASQHGSDTSGAELGSSQDVRLDNFSSSPTIVKGGEAGP
jgi:hypothetical protein